jgi:glucan biosynthesis protein
VRFRRVDRGKALELRANLTQGNEVLTETWSYILPAE